ncbi:MAG: cupin domain-containing protein [Christiangramia sp.]|uniref:cupin domain-containing protein n=1 Tax=Christiangramia sp. TaxID=1931228 RepID=UPI003242B8A7
MRQDIQNTIEKLQLQPHPEGGYFREIYRSPEIIPKKALKNNYSGDRNVCTSIYFLLTSESFSAFHKIHQDEIWHFYQGSRISLQIISASGEHSEIMIGNNLQKNEHLQYVVPGGNYFAASVQEPDSFALIGCTVAPGFDFDDFYIPKREELLKKFPRHANVIHQYTREN